MELAPGDEILTSDEEHPGLLGALGAARELHGVSVREVPLRRGRRGGRARRRASSPARTSSWATGALAPAELGRARRARAARRRAGDRRGPRRRRARSAATPTPARARSGCCGPDGTGRSVRHARAARAPRASRAAATATSPRPNAGLDATLHEDGRRFDAPSLSAEALACAAGRRRGARVERLGRACTSAPGRSRRGSPRCSPSAAARRRRAAPRTLVSFPSEDAGAERELLAERGRRHPQHPRPPLAARLGRRLERRGRPRATGGGARR